MREWWADRRLVWHQVRYQNKIFWRTPIAAFFTLVFPLMFLVVFTAVFGNDRIDELGITTAQFYAPALAVFAAASATYTNLAVSTAIVRDEGILKRVRGTPLPPWVYMTGRIGSAVWIALLAVTMMMSVGVVLFSVEIIGARLPAALAVFSVGVCCFAALGLTVAALVRDAESAPAVANATLLPLAFLSDIFIPAVDPSPWLEVAGNLFPLKHFAVAFSGAFNPTLSGDGWAWSGGPGEYAIGEDLAVMALWGIAAVLVALRTFTWEPRGREGRRGRRRRAKAAA